MVQFLPHRPVVKCHRTWCILTWPTSYFRGSTRSILGPALFLIYVNSLLSAVRNSQVMMFADGTKIYKEIKSREDCASLQEDLDSLSAWSADTGLSFNVTKYNVQTITRKRRPISASYQITGCVINATASERDLGVSVSSDLPMQTSSWDTSKGMLNSL